MRLTEQVHTTAGEMDLLSRALGDTELQEETRTQHSVHSSQRRVCGCSHGEEEAAMPGVLALEASYCGFRLDFTWVSKHPHMPGGSQHSWPAQCHCRKRMASVASSAAADTRNGG